MEAFDEIQASPKAKNLKGHFAASGLNALGGIMAGRVRGTFAAQFPNFKGAGTIAIFVLSVAIRWFAQSEKGWDRALKEIAAGMAGFVGNDLYLLTKMWLGWGKWKDGKDYKAGDVVESDKKYYKAAKDIPSTPKAEPGKDARWVLVELAEGFDFDQVRLFAQGISDNEALVDGLAKEQILLIGPELEQMTGRAFSQAEADSLYLGMRDSLKSVVTRLKD